MNYAFWFRLIVSVIVTAVLVQAIAWDDFPARGDIIFAYLFAAWLLVLLNRCINAYRWYLLINNTSLQVGLSHVMGIYFKSAFVGLVMPSSVGGEFLKGYGLMKTGSGAVDSFSSIFMERLLGLISLLGTALIGVVSLKISLEELHIDVLVRVLWIMLALLIGVLICSYFAASWLGQRLRSHRKLDVLLTRLSLSFAFYQQIKFKLFVAFVLSFIIQLFRIYGAWLIGLGLGMSVELTYYILFIPIISLISMIPISIAGLGVQEGAFVYFFSLTGTNSTTILALALVQRFLLIIAVLPGGFLYLRDGLWKKSPQNETSNTHT